MNDRIIKYHDPDLHAILKDYVWKLDDRGHTYYWIIGDLQLIFIKDNNTPFGAITHTPTVYWTSLYKEKNISITTKGELEMVLDLVAKEYLLTKNKES